MDLEQRTDGDVIVLLVSGDLTLKNAWGSPLADSVRSALQLGHARFVLTAVDVVGHESQYSDIKFNDQKSIDSWFSHFYK